MRISTANLDSGTLKISVEGKLNVLTSVDFRRTLDKIAAGKKIIFDFRKLDYISSAGLREILICRKNFPDMRIENVNREVQMIFMMTGFDKFIPITPADAGATFNRSRSRCERKRLVKELIP